MIEVDGESLIELVALLAEGVDRNFTVKVTISQRHVALFAEGVDRNMAAVYR